MSSILRSSIEAMEKRVLLAGNVSGTVYNDGVGLGTNLTANQGVAGETVYADLSNSGHLVAGDPSTTTDATGNYSLTGLPAGPVILRVVLQPINQGTQRQSFPAGAVGQHVNLATDATGVNFGVTATSYASGVVFLDKNGDGVRESNEPGLANVNIHTSNSSYNGIVDGLPPATVTAADGSFTIAGLGLAQGLFLDPIPAGYRQTLPAGFGRISLPYQTGGVFQGLQFGIAPAATTALTGSYLGTAGSYKNQGNTGPKAFDGNLNTYFDAPTSNGASVGLDLGSPKVITQISFAPRSAYPSRMVGGVFQASNSATFSDAVVNLYTVNTAPAAGTLTTVPTVTYSAYRYVRYVGPAGSFCNVAEVHFFGTTPIGSAYVQNGTLHVQGSSGADRIEITIIKSLDELSPFGIVTDVNGVQQTFDPQTISTVSIQSYEGNDTITVFDRTSSDYATVPVSIVAGNGNDTFSTDLGDQYYGTQTLSILAGSGNDSFQLAGFGLGQTITAGNGNDGFYTAIDGSGGLGTTINAGNGNDTIGAGSSGPADSQGIDFTFGSGNDIIINSDLDDHMSGTVNGVPIDVEWQDVVLTGTVYLDNNGNGKLDAGDSPVSNAALTLSYTDGSGQLAQTTTDASGKYSLKYTFSDGFNVPLVTKLTVPSGLVATSPASGAITYNDGSGEGMSGINFGLRKAVSGTPIGTPGSYRNHSNTLVNAFDGDLSTFFDGPDATGDWVGLDLGSAKVMTQVQFAPRAGWESRMGGGMIQASNSANFSSGVVTLYTIKSTPAAGVLTTVKFSNATAYRYYRYVGPTNSYCDIAELNFLS